MTTQPLGSTYQKIETLPQLEQKGVQRLTCSLSCLATALLIAALAGATFIVLSRMQFFGPVNSAGSLGALGIGSALILGSIIGLAIVTLKKSNSPAKETFSSSSTTNTSPSLPNEQSSKTIVESYDLPMFNEAIGNNQKLIEEVTLLYEIAIRVPEAKEFFDEKLHALQQQDPSAKNLDKNTARMLQAGALIQLLVWDAIQKASLNTPDEEIQKSGQAALLPAFMNELKDFFQEYSTNRFALWMILQQLSLPRYRDLLKALFENSTSVKIFLNAFDKEADTLLFKFCLYFNIFPSSFLDKETISYFTFQLFGSRDNEGTITKEQRIAFVASFGANYPATKDLELAFSDFVKIADDTTCYECLLAVFKRASCEIADDSDILYQLSHAVRFLKELMGIIVADRTAKSWQAFKNTSYSTQEFISFKGIEEHFQEFLPLLLPSIKQQPKDVPANEGCLFEYYLYGTQLALVLKEEDVNEKDSKKPYFISESDFQHLVTTLPLKARPLLKQFFPQGGIAEKAEALLNQKSRFMKIRG